MTNRLDRYTTPTKVHLYTDQEYAEYVRSSEGQATGRIRSKEEIEKEQEKLDEVISLVNIAASSGDRFDYPTTLYRVTHPDLIDPRTIKEMDEYELRDYLHVLGVINQLRTGQNLCLDDDYVEYIKQASRKTRNEEEIRLDYARANEVAMLVEESRKHKFNYPPTLYRVTHPDLLLNPRKILEMDIYEASDCEWAYCKVGDFRFIPLEYRPKYI
jgi:hypothetical protein